MTEARFTARMLRTDPRLGLFIRIPATVIADWGLTATTTVEGEIGGIAIGRRAIKDSGPKTPDWYMSLTRDLTDTIGAIEGAEVAVHLWPADMTVPKEMQRQIDSDPLFARAFAALSANHRRKAIEHYLEAKTPAGRAARLAKIDRSIKARLGGAS